MNDINRISQHLIAVDDKRRSLAARLIDLNSHLIKQVGKLEEQDFVICGVDGGLVKKEYHGAGLILRRATAVCFTYKNQKLVSSRYLPGGNVPPEPIVTGPEFSEQDFNIEANLRRVEAELKVAIESVLKFKPDLMILDGSVLLYPASVPDKSSPAQKTYKEVVELYKKLYSVCDTSETFLVGVVEDSRGKKFCDLLKAKNPEMEAELKDVNDTLLLHYMLKAGQKTDSFGFSHPEDLAFTQDMGSWSEKVLAMYIKPVEFDRPLRIEFLSKGDPDLESETISKVVHKISSHNRYYCYPSVIIEADARAKLTETEVEMFKQMIAEKIGFNPAFFDLRRENRPF